MQYLHDLGPLAIASRLRNLTDLLVLDMVRVYRSQGLEFEPRWFTFVHLISNKGPLSVTQIARELGQTHPAANQVANALEKHGYITSRKDKKDQRKRIIGLSEKGKKLVTLLLPLWNAVESAVQELLEGTCPRFMDDIGTIEQQLLNESIEKRILRNLRRLENTEVEIVPFRPGMEDSFRALNEEWLNTYFSVEPEDERLLSDPQIEIIDKGGVIVFAKRGTQIIGTGALLHLDANTCELTKMAVTPNFQGNQTGRKILRHLVATAIDKRYNRIILLTSEKLHKAVSLYRSEGFVNSSQSSSMKHNYKRCSIQMEYKLNPNN